MRLEQKKNLLSIILFGHMMALKMTKMAIQLLVKTPNMQIRSLFMIVSENRFLTMLGKDTTAACLLTGRQVLENLIRWQDTKQIKE